jgi:hypothetical protein
VEEEKMTASHPVFKPVSLPDFQKCFIDSTAVQANTERSTGSSILVGLIARVCTADGNLHRLDLPDLNQIGLLEPAGRASVPEPGDSFPQWQNAGRSTEPGYHARSGSSARSTIDHGTRSTMNMPRSRCLFAMSSHTVPNHSPRLHETECSEIFQGHVIANQFFDSCWAASWLIPKLHARLYLSVQRG